MSLPAGPYVEAMVIMIAADGVFAAEEKEHFRAALVSHPATKHLTGGQIDSLINESVEALEREGVDARIQSLAERVPETLDREQIVHAVVMACVSDGEVADEEMTVLEKLQVAFGMPDERLKAIVAELMPG